MKVFSVSAFCIFLFVLSMNNATSASEITVSGSVYFKCNFISSYMEKHGYILIEKDLFMNNLKTDRYAANYAEVFIKNQKNDVVGSGKTDEKGRFSITVPEEYVYRVAVRFHDREIEETISYEGAENITADLGYFDTEKVGSWIPIPTLRYCYTCNIRYLETKKIF